MNLKRYYSEIREIEASLDGEHILMMSLDTEDGGRAGVVTEVPRYEAALMIKQQRGRVLSEEESAGYRLSTAERRVKANEARLAERLHVTVVSTDALLQAKTRERLSE